MSRALLLASLALLLSPLLGSANTRPSPVSHSSLNPMTAVDEQLYSRQMLVYGASAQHSLAAAHVLVLGNGPLAAEVTKNLALAGVGRLTVVDDASSAQLRLKGDASTLSAYARELNPHIQVLSVDGVHAESALCLHDYTCVVATDSSLSVLLGVNEACRARGVPLVGCEVAGVCGFVFDDFLDTFTALADPEDSSEIPLVSWEALDNDIQGHAQLRIVCIEEERLNLSEGDQVELHTGGLTLSARVREVHSTRSALLDLPIAALDDVKQCASLSIRRVSSLSTLRHLPLSAYLAPTSSRTLFNPTNACLSDKQNQALSATLAAAFLALGEEAGPHEEGWPSRQDREAFIDAITQRLVGLGVLNPLHSVKQGGVGEYLSHIAEGVFRSRGGRCPATVSVIGAIAAQEVIKAVTHVHSPLTQMILFESLDSLSTASSGSSTSDASDMDRVYGTRLTTAANKLRVFVVGAGAIGCELLKNLALMGVGCPRDDPLSTQQSTQQGSLFSKHGLHDGGIVVTDMDSIEKSNLSRQLLFRASHIGKSKAHTAAASVRSINPSIRVWGVDAKVSSDNTMFDQAFWNDASVIAAALDNVEARQFVDSECVRYSRCMLDAGTMGVRGNTQVVFPHLTESYSSSADPPDSSVPLCTLKSFPYQAEHCVAWAKTLFETIFGTDVTLLKKLLRLLSFDDKDALAVEIEALSEEEATRLVRNVHVYRNSSEVMSECVRWAVDLFREHFVEDVARLIRQHPIDEVDEQGGPFWSGSRRYPKQVDLDGRSEEHRAFVLWAATLKYRSMVCEGDSDERLDTLSNALEKLKTEYSPTALASMAESLSPQSFEKDEPLLGHVDWIASAANARCAVYGIKPIDKMQAQRIAGRIIPALATTTALVSGLVCLELMKVLALQEKCASKNALELFRNSFVNLAMPSLSFAQPVEAETFTVGMGRQRFSIWDVIVAPLSVHELTVRALESHISTTLGVRLQSIALGDVLLYADFMGDAEMRRDMTIGLLCSLGGDDSDDEDGFSDERVSRSSGAFIAELPESGFVDVSITCVDDDGDDVRTPAVRVAISAPSDQTPSKSKALRRMFSSATNVAKNLLSRTGGRRK